MGFCVRPGDGKRDLGCFGAAVKPEGCKRVGWVKYSVVVGIIGRVVVKYFVGCVVFK